MSQIPPHQPVLGYAAPFAEPPRRRAWVWILVIVGVVVALGCGGFSILLVVPHPKPDYAAISLDQFYRFVETQRIESITIEGDTVYGTFKNGNETVYTKRGQINAAKFQTEIPAGTSSSGHLFEWLQKNRGTMSIEVANNNGYWAQLIMSLVPWVLIFFIVVLILWWNGRKAAALRRQPMKVIIVGREEPHELGPR